MTVDDSVVQRLWKLTNELTAQLVFNRNATLELKQQLADLQVKHADLSLRIANERLMEENSQLQEQLREYERWMEYIMTKFRLQNDLAIRLQEENTMLQARLTDVGTVARKAINDEYYNTDAIIETLEIENQGLREMLGVASEDFSSLATRQPRNRVSFPSTGSYVASSGSDREQQHNHGFAAPSSPPEQTNRREASSPYPTSLSGSSSTPKPTVGDTSPGASASSTASTASNSTATSPVLKTARRSSAEPLAIDAKDVGRKPTTTRKKSDENMPSTSGTKSGMTINTAVGSKRTSSSNTSNSSSTDSPEDQPVSSNPKELLQILFKSPSQEAEKNGHDVTEEAYVRMAGAREYVIYGCIGLLDLQTGPYFIAITSVKELGKIEDKPVYAINKVAVLPMDADAACQILCKLAQQVGPSSELAIAVEQTPGLQGTDAELPREEESKDELPVERRNDEATAPLATAKSPKVRFSFLTTTQDTSLQVSSPSPSPPPASKPKDLGHEAAAASPPKSRRISFELPRFNQGNKSNTNLASSTTPKTETMETNESTPSAQTGFFAKLKESVLEKKSKTSIDGAISSVAAVESDSSPKTDFVSVPSEHLTGPGEDLDSSFTPTSTSNVVATIISPDPVNKSSSALATAERFMIESTKQIASWGEEAVSGLLKTSSAVHPGEEDKVRSTSGAGADHRIAEEELEKDRVLDRRIIREISSIINTGFYFATEVNLLLSKQKRSDLARDEGKENALLWQQADCHFWWNEHLLKEFIGIEATGYILPIMQGYVEIEQCVIEEQPFEFTLISRRSRERSGLRYQRRGIDENGNTANFVETEQLLRIVRDDSDHQVSFVQTRGSIPLFWSQSPYRLKPVPVLERSDHENQEGFKKHVDSQLRQYGQQVFINLVEHQGREMIAGSAYRRYVEKLSSPQVRYIEFDFHEQCKGMKYENIERLVKSLEIPISELGYCWITPKTNESVQGVTSLERLHEQKGVIRTNCMDCLDRTNVVQSAIGRYILNRQLLRLGIASFPDQGLSVYEDFENVFNNIWANNGDAISREYAGTSALKGDFTRTGKRNLQGMINDATNSMARMYQNTFKDYFRQATIDYLLGVAELNIFKNLQTTVIGTAVIPTPVLPPPDTPSHKPPASEPAPPSLLLSTTDPSATKETVGAAVLLPPLLSLPSSEGKTTPEPRDERALQQETWFRIREAAIETSAKIVISPGEKQWKGWTFICCTSEINSSLATASSSQQIGSRDSSPNAQTTSTKPQPGNAPVFYDEKIVLLTERALYICTYDYEMEKVLEFWRLALEKMTAIDKGAYFLTAQDKSRQGQDPLENYGFAVVYRANSAGETLRVNCGSVRNRKIMGINRTSPEEAFNLDRVPEAEEESDNTVAESQQSGIGSANDTNDRNGRYSDNDQMASEPSNYRSVRFKIVKHPETSMVPFATSSEPDPGQNKAAPTRYRRTAQDCVEWIVTEVVQARCELISVAEKGADNKILQGQGRSMGGHSRTPSEEYNCQAPSVPHRPSVQVNLVIRDRVLQSLEVAAQLEKDALKSEQDRASKSKKPFTGLFSSSRPSKEQSTQQQSAGVPSTNISWLKRFQFGMDTDSETDDDDDDEEEEEEEGDVAVAVKTGSASDDQPVVKANQDPTDTTKNRSQSVFAKFRQAVKSL
ncbi:hypothetical protein BGZ65_002572 [Modicella reniformis]|uniref:SAC domain-containing protein n=1 Tax=Modicella reniformis TaxID=1440133 RepID=A0A9P6J141_9FUNG|nr:hypothetical protein BGZ65_002572 [Modicella reniformis]